MQINSTAEFVIDRTVSHKEILLRTHRGNDAKSSSRTTVNFFPIDCYLRGRCVRVSWQIASKSDLKSVKWNLGTLQFSLFSSNLPGHQANSKKLPDHTEMQPYLRATS